MLRASCFALSGSCLLGTRGSDAEEARRLSTVTPWNMEPCMSASMLYSMLISCKKKRNAKITLSEMVKEST